MGLCGFWSSPDSIAFLGESVGAQRNAPSLSKSVDTKSVDMKCCVCLTTLAIIVHSRCLGKTVPHPGSNARTVAVVQSIRKAVRSSQ